MTTRWHIPRQSRAYDAALFDLDGVVTQTVDLHMAAWRALFQSFFEAEGVDEPYTDADYHAYVDGRPRYDGVRACLASRGIVLPEGAPDDEPGTSTVCGLGNLKNEEFDRMLEEMGVDPYPGTVALLEHLEQTGTPRALVTSSRNAFPVLEAAGLLHVFDTVVDGNVASEQKLGGKPAPDTFAYAAAQLGVPVPDAVVLEDAVSGVMAGHRGGFGLVVGVDRGAGAAALRRAGADVVVSDLAELVP